MPRAHMFGEFFAVTHGDAKSATQEVTPPEFEGETERENYSYFISAEKMSPKGLILEVIHLSLYVSSLTGKHPEKNILHFTRNFVETGFCSWVCGGGIYCVVFPEKSSTKSDPAWKPIFRYVGRGGITFTSQKHIDPSPVYTHTKNSRSVALCNFAKKERIFPLSRKNI